MQLNIFLEIKLEFDKIKNNKYKWEVIYDSMGYAEKDIE